MPLRHSVGKLPWLVALVPLIGASCAPSPPRLSHVLMTREPSQLAEDIRSPIRVSLEGPARVAIGRCQLQLVVERLVDLGEEIHVSVRAPAGARLLTPGDVVIARGVGSERIPIVLDLASIPTADVVGVVDVAAPGFGFHAEPHYSFGRSRGDLQRPTLGTPVVLGGHDLGAPVVLPARPSPESVPVR